MPTIEVVRPEERHRAAWDTLYQGYAQFYRVEQTVAMRERVWGWINDAANEVECFLAVETQDSGDHGSVVGLAHFREFARPLAASRGGYLDDLFVDPAARGSGAGVALLTSLAEEARRREWTVIRWITADDNYRARGLYDKVALRTPWITYDMQPAPGER